MKPSHWRRLAIIVACTTLNSQAAVRYVDVNSTNATPLFTNWSSAAVTIQDAVDAADPGDEVLVNNGVYQSGGRAVQGTLTNRVAVDKPVPVRSVNGPQFTVIQGYQTPGIIGDGAIRCVYLTNGASLSGFTLTKGATQTVPLLTFNPVAIGGGLWCEGPAAVVSNCVVTGNVSFLGGGGVRGGTLYDCTLSANRDAHFFPAGGGGVFSSTLYRCILSGNSSVSDGGGASSSTLTDCTLTGNSAAEDGGGAAGCTLSNCTLSGNSGYFGGGAGGCTLNNCTLKGNSGTEGGGAAFSLLNNCVLVSNSASYAGGGARYSTLNNCTVGGNSAVRYGGGVDSTDASTVLNNCVIYYNTAPSQPNYSSVTLNHCCTTGFPAGTGNFTSVPLFVDVAGGDLRLQPNSPCINAGRNDYVSGSTDLDGNRRIVSGTVDIGAYEFIPPDVALFNQWLAQFGLPINGSADFTDNDGDGMNNSQEWIAGTIPTNSSSVLRLTTVSRTASGLDVTWQSVATRNYSLLRGTNLSTALPFSTITTNIPGQLGTTTYSDTNAVGPGPFFYRVGVEP